MRAGPGDSVLQGHALSFHDLVTRLELGPFIYNWLRNFYGAKLENETCNGACLKQFQECYQIKETAIEINS